MGPEEALGRLGAEGLFRCRGADAPGDPRPCGERALLRVAGAPARALGPGSHLAAGCHVLRPSGLGGWAERRGLAARGAGAAAAVCLIAPLVPRSAGVRILTRRWDAVAALALGRAIPP